MIHYRFYRQGEGSMLERHVLGALGMVSCLIIAACQSPQQTLVEEGYQPVSPQELKAMYVGKTVKTTGGKDYYAPNGSYVSLWEGTIYEGTWRTQEPNKMCWDVAAWGSIPCSEMYKSGDNLKGIYKGKVFDRPPSAFEDGNTIQ